MTRPRKARLMADDHLDGSLDAPVWLLMYGDYECPYTGRAMGAVEGARLYLGPQFHFAYRHFPLDKHTHARLAAQVAEAAHEQGRFWEMHSLLFENQQHLDREQILVFAQELRLDVDRFIADVDDPAIVRRVEKHRRSGGQLGVEETPTFFLNGERYKGRYDLRSLIGALDEAAGHSPVTADRQRHPFLP